MKTGDLYFDSKGKIEITFPNRMQALLFINKVFGISAMDTFKLLLPNVPNDESIKVPASMFFEEAKNIPVTYHAGQKFIIKGEPQRKYILAAIEVDQVVLINLEDGNRWSSPFYVEDIDEITEEELESGICLFKRFELIEEVTNVL